MSKRSFKTVQLEFANYLRNPGVVNAPQGIEKRRLAVYRGLISANIQNFVDSGFPVLKRITPAGRWQELIDSFIANYFSTSPYFVDISGAFVDFLTSGQVLTKNDPPYIGELAHYEWVELSVSLLELEDGVEAVAELTPDTAIQLNSTAQLLSYSYEVEKISPDFLPATVAPETVHILVYRDLAGRVRFFRLSTMTVLLLRHLQQSEYSSNQDLTEAMQAALPQLAKEVVAEGLTATLTEFAKRQVILTRTGG